MAASATARAARTAPRRRTSARATARTRSAAARPRRSAAAPARLVPIAAVGRTAVAVGGLADSGLVFRLTRGRLWIGVLATLLVGIVALNVMALSFNASATKVAGQSDGLNRANSALRAQVASELSNETVQGAAAERGLIVPEPGAIQYLSPSPGDAEVAARRLTEGVLEIGPAPVEIAPAIVPPALEGAAEPDAAEPVATDPAAIDAAAAAPAANPATPVPAPVPAGGAPAAGGIAP
jgi:hypothetical protein